MNKIKIGTISGLFCLTALLIFYGSSRGEEKEAPSVKTVTIREGLSVSGVSKLLRSEGILREKDSLPHELEGYLFPDTYEFYVPSSLGFVVGKMEENFNDKALPNIPAGMNIEEVVTVASMVQQEVRDPEDMQLVAGIIWRRLRSRMPLQVDATICYVKPPPCHPIGKADLQIDSPYNTYRYKGLPPGPVSNPGLAAINASVSPKESPYWFYISRPDTGETVFGRTLDEHNYNVAKYLRK